MASILATLSSSTYQDMRAEDPAQAEDFKKQMTERFQKIDVSGDGDDSEEYKD